MKGKNKMLDDLLKFSDKQAITATAASENIIDLGKDREVAFGNPIPLLAIVKEDFNNATSLKIAVETSAAEDFTTSVELASSTVLLANLKKGNMIPLSFMPAGNKGFVRLKYTVTGTAPTTGKISAYLTDAIPQSHQDK